jgi:hypothetical protein
VRNTVGRGRPGDAAQAAREITRMMLDGWRVPETAPRTTDTLRGLEQRITRLESNLKRGRSPRADKETTT